MHGQTRMLGTYETRAIKPNERIGRKRSADVELTCKRAGMGRTIVLGKLVEHAQHAQGEGVEAELLGRHAPRFEET
jgi:hypothetical protein